MGGRQKVEVPTGGRPGWGEGACSASDEGVRAGVCAASEGSEWVAQGPGLEPGFHVDQQAVPGNSWVPAAYAAHFERPAAGSGVDAGLRPGLRGLRAPAAAGAEACLVPFVHHAVAPYRDTSAPHWGPCYGVAGVGGVGQTAGFVESSVDGP